MRGAVYFLFSPSYFSCVFFCLVVFEPLPRTLPLFSVFVLYVSSCRFSAAALRRYEFSPGLCFAFLALSVRAPPSLLREEPKWREGGGVLFFSFFFIRIRVLTADFFIFALFSTASFFLLINFG